MLKYLTEKKDLTHQQFGKFYFKYGCFCSTRPILMISFSCIVVILCSLPLTSFPIFERIIAFLFQRIRVSYNTNVSLAGDEQAINATTFGYIQQVNINATIHGHTDLTKEDVVDNLLQIDAVYKFEKKLREATGSWNKSCMKLQRDTPSMKALKKRIKFSHSSIHGDLKMRRIYLLNCLYISPTLLFDNGRMIHIDDFSVTFQELSLGYPARYYKGKFSEGSNVTKHISVVFTLFLKEKNENFHNNLLKELQQSGLEVDSSSSGKSYKIYYQFSDDSGPAELLPLGMAYLVVFLYLWFSVAKLDFVRTRWGLAFAAVMNFVASFVMAIGICAFFDALPTTLNVGEIFPYVVILIGIENFWIITKSVMTTKKDLSVKERVGIGLGLEGWYITKNLLVEITLLGIGYLSGVKGVQEFSVFAFACYVSDFFLQLAFYTPILAVDIRRAEVGLPFSNRSAWKYALYIDLEKPEGSKKVSEEPRQKYSTAVRLAFSLARYRVLQRTVMVFIIVYFLFTVSHPLQEIVNPTVTTVTSKELQMSNQDLSDHMSCWNTRDSMQKSSITSWLFLCNKHWPELLNYYFEHLNNKFLIILPQINLRTSLQADSLEQPVYTEKYTFLQDILGFLKEASKPMVAICVIVLLTALYKLLYFIQAIIKQLGSDDGDVYTCESHVLNVPTTKIFPFKVTKMVVDDSDVLVSAYVNGSVYVWDLYSDRCSYYINRRAKRVYNLAISRSTSTHSLPTPEDSHMKKEQSRQELPRAVWSIAYKSDVLIIGCAKGTVEVYSLENECLQCFHQSDNESGVVSVQIISCLRFVIAHKSGIVEFCHIKNARGSRNRANSLPNDDPAHVGREMEVSRVVIVSYQPILWMEIALNKVFVASEQGQVKVLRARDDGGIPLQCHIPRDQEITFLRTEMSPEMALVGTSTGNVYVVNSVGQLEKILYCGDDEVMSIASNDDYIAVHCYDGCTTVWLKEGYIKWWQLNMLSYGAVYEILSLARYSLAAVTKENVILLSIVTRSVVSCVRYESSPNFGLIMASPVVCQNKSSICVPSASSIAHLKFPKLIDHDR